MVSFEISVIDIALIIAIIIVLLLQITRTPGKSTTAEPELLLDENRGTLEDSRKDIVMPETSEKKGSSHTGSLKGLAECPHQFGYLGKLPKRSSVPEECYSCSRMMHCLFSSE